MEPKLKPEYHDVFAEVAALRAEVVQLQEDVARLRFWAVEACEAEARLSGGVKAGIVDACLRASGPPWGWA